jgi:glucose/arabinose dehydrogenase
MLHRTLVSTLVLVLMAASASADYTIEDAFPMLPALTEPVDLQDPLDGTDRLFVVEKAGTIRVFDNDPAVNSGTLFLSVVDSVTNQWESGLLGLAFHPNYENNGYFYVTYVTKDPMRTKLSRFSVSGNPDVADPASELSLLEIRQFQLYHKAGGLVFGPDGYLYMTTGEDGSINESQSLTSLKGKLLRIDVDNPSGGKNYGIPPDNPFAGNPSGYREEIWAYGFRNPWRFSFDEWTGRLWVGDVGLDTWEEIDLIKKGRNYGWPRMEGTMCIYPPVCDTTGLNIDLPFYEYPHTSEYGGAITGGYVYRGTRLPALHGWYVYADYTASEMFALLWDGVNPPVNKMLYAEPLPPFFRPTDFCEDKDRELFFPGYNVGRIFQLVQIPSAAGETRPVTPLLSVHPNPFAGEARIRYTSPSAADLEVYDVRGRLVWRAAGKVRGSGEATWDGKDLAGHASASGVYFVRLTGDGGAVAARRLVLVK